jgi:oligopeptidase B
MLLYAYGSYGISVDATFAATRLPLLDRGVSFAIAHLRGGGEYGEAWRLAGNLFAKRTTFTDFIDCAWGLVAAGYTTPEQLVIQGGSAGGLLMGAVVNMRPDLFAAAIVAVPFVDVLTTMLDASLPLTTGEYREWGNPNEIAAYEYMRSYSPVDNVRAQPYPRMLIEVALYDSQVPYWEGVKFAAKLREVTTSANPILVKVNLGAGHSGASGRYDALKDYAFVLSAVGMSDGDLAD